MSGTKNQNAPSSLIVLSAITQGVQVLAKHANDLDHCIESIENLVVHLKQLSMLRVCAEAFVDLHRQLPWLERVAMEVTQHPDSGLQLNVVDISVENLEFDESLWDMMSGLSMALSGSNLGVEDSLIPSPVFNRDLDQLYEIQTSEDLAGDTSRPYSLTSTASVTNAAVEHGIDAVAKVLFPHAWEATADALNLPRIECESIGRPRPR